MSDRTHAAGAHRTLLTDEAIPLVALRSLAPAHTAPGPPHHSDVRGAEALVQLTRDDKKRKRDAEAADAAGLGAALPPVAKTCPSWWLQDHRLVRLLEGTRFALCIGVGVSPSLVTVPVTEGNLRDAYEAARLFDNMPRGRLVCAQFIQAWVRFSFASSPPGRSPCQALSSAACCHTARHTPDTLLTAIRWKTPPQEAAEAERDADQSGEQFGLSAEEMAAAVAQYKLAKREALEQQREEQKQKQRQREEEEQAAAGARAGDGAAAAAEGAAVGEQAPPAGGAAGAGAGLGAGAADRGAAMLFGTPLPLGGGAEANGGELPAAPAGDTAAAGGRDDSSAGALGGGLGLFSADEVTGGVSG